MNARAVRHLVAVVILVLAATPAWPHPEDAWIHQTRALALWAEAVSHGSTDAVATLTAPGSEPFPVSLDTSVVTAHAVFTPTQGGALASPVVLITDRGTVMSAWSVLLTEDSEGWKVAGAIPSGDLPPALVDDNLPEHAHTHAVAFTLTDADTGAPVHARVRITDASGGYWPPDAHQKNVRLGWRQDVGGDVHVGGKTYAYVSPEFLARLPAGKYTIEVRKGTEYLPASKTFMVDGDRSGEARVAVAVPRWVNMSASGWHAGDTHTHFLDEHSALLELRAEDLSVLYILATKWGELITDAGRFTGTPSHVSGIDEVVVVNEETRHRWLGHTILHGIEALVYPLTWGGPTEGVPGGYDYPAMAHQADRTHEQGGLVTWAHFPYPGGELPIDVALGKVDTVDLFTWGDAFAPGPTLPNGTVLPSTVDTWYLFLNTNAQLPATAGTDKMLNVQVVGSVRTYAHTGRRFSYAAWLDALKRGATLVSTGPVVTLTANGRPIGSNLVLAPGEQVVIEARMEAPYELYPVDVLEIVVGGTVVETVANTAGSSQLHAATTVSARESTWIAARARGSKVMPYQVWRTINATGIPPMAHTSPIYLSVEGRPVWVPEAARQLKARVEAAINWVETQGRYRTEAEREEIVALFQRARQHYTSGPHRGEPGQ